MSRITNIHLEKYIERVIQTEKHVIYKISKTNSVISKN